LAFGRPKLDLLDSPCGRTNLRASVTRWLSVEEIAAHLGIKPDTVYKWIERRNMAAHELGWLRKLQATEVDEWVRSGAVSQLASDASGEADYKCAWRSPTTM